MGKEIHEKVKVYIDLLDSLRDGPKPPKELIVDLGIAESTFYHIVGRLQDWDKIVKEEGKYRLVKGKVTASLYGMYELHKDTNKVSFVNKPTERQYSGHPVLHALHQTYPEDSERAYMAVVIRISNKTQSETVGISRVMIVCKDPKCPLQTELTEKGTADPFHVRMEPQETVNKTLTASFNSKIGGKPKDDEKVVEDVDAVIELFGMDDEVIEKLPIIIRFVKGHISHELLDV